MASKWKTFTSSVRVALGGAARPAEASQRALAEVSHSIRRATLTPALNPHSFRNYVFKARALYRETPDSLQSQFITLCNEKRLAYRLVEHVARERLLALSPPEVYAAGIDIHDVDPGIIGRHAVLKPAGGAASRGLFCLEREGDAFRETVRNRTFSWEQLRAAYLEERDAAPDDRRFTKQVIVEEWIRDDVRGPIPLDYRMYSFFGRVGMIMQRDCNGGREKSARRFRYYDASWNDLGDARGAGQIDETLEPPELALQATRLAEVLSAHIPLPFMRVDFYITKQGVRFGEFTPFPGSHGSYNRSVDAWMGRLWDDAEWRLSRSRFPERDEVVRILEGGSSEPKRPEADDAQRV